MMNCALSSQIGSPEFRLSFSPVAVEVEQHTAMVAQEALRKSCKRCEDETQRKLNHPFLPNVRICRACNQHFVRIVRSIKLEAAHTSCVIEGCLNKNYKEFYQVNQKDEKAGYFCASHFRKRALLCPEEAPFRPIEFPDDVVKMIQDLPNEYFDDLIPADHSEIVLKTRNCQTCKDPKTRKYQHPINKDEKVCCVCLLHFNKMKRIQELRKMNAVCSTPRCENRNYEELNHDSKTGRLICLNCRIRRSSKKGNKKVPFLYVHSRKLLMTPHKEIPDKVFSSFTQEEIEPLFLPSDSQI